MVALNAIARACAYPDVSSLVVDNVDYMVNSVALRLNTLDVSPASTRVLRMMVRLAGPRVVPFLDDVVVSILSTLESYHGYARFVDGLFAALTEIVEQGVRSDVLYLEGAGASKAPDHRKKAVTLADVADEAEAWRKLLAKDAAEPLDDDGHGGSHPKTAWGPPKDDRQGGGPGTAGEGDYDGVDPDEKVERPASPTYQILLRIADLTQHYLTSPTPALRRSLLVLLATVSPALAADEDRFLPLIHRVWPVVVPRVYDAEPYVAEAACDAIAALCVAAGDFMRSRVHAEWEDRLGKWCRDAKRCAEGGGGGSALGRKKNNDPWRRAGRDGDGDVIYDAAEGGKRSIRIPGREPASQPSSAMVPRTTTPAAGSALGRFSAAARLWAAAQRLLVAIVAHVSVDEGVFAEILDLLRDVARGDQGVREVLEVVDAAAVRVALGEGVGEGGVEGKGGRRVGIVEEVDEVEGGGAGGRIVEVVDDE
jgi:hypothetical protein